MWHSYMSDWSNIAEQRFYQEATVVELQVQELKKRVCNLMIVIVDNVTAEDDSTAGVFKATKQIERDLEELLR